MGKVTFDDYTIQVQGEIDSRITAALEAAAGEMESQVKRNTAVDTGKTKNSWRHHVDGNTASIGSDYENAIWEEFGTGQYALNGDGRKGGWVYKDAKGKSHYTVGKRPKRAFLNAYNSKKNEVVKIIKEAMKGM